MAVYIWEEDAFEKMVQIEGEDWRRHVKNFGECGFDAFKKDFESMEFTSERIQQFIKEESNGVRHSHLTVNGNAAIYGYGGWNRYSVSCSGEIVFLMAFCEDQKDEQKARELGFTVR